MFQPVMSSPPTATMTSSNMMMMSPPQSVQSNMSPLHHGLSPPHHGHTMSPVKARQGGQQQQQQQQQQLPTSPTHMAAMRGATQQARQAANSQFDFPEMFSQQQQFMYPTPPHQGGHQAQQGKEYMTPSPDSPGQWSSELSPQSHSDWSEGIHSPPSAYQQQQQQQHMQQQCMQQQQPQDNGGVLI